MPKSFKPFIDKSAKILVLGTMPGAASLEAAQYYAYKHNKFWPVIFEIFENGRAPRGYQDKLRTLQKNNIALWDTLKQCRRQGSLDSAIKSGQPNNIPLLLRKHPVVKRIIFNGAAAHKYYVKHFGLPRDVEYLLLPSTSPANAKTPYAQKLKLWRAALCDGIN